MSKCEECGKEVKTLTEIDQGEKYICDECLKNGDYFQCDQCGEWYSTEYKAENCWEKWGIENLCEGCEADYER